jgi:DNA-binding beta-propeller fold protein YncE
LGCFFFLLGCGSPNGSLEQAWGKKGLYPGEFVRPRAMACDNRPGHEKLFVVDFEGRIQAFTPEGKPLGLWKTPAIANGRPAGIGVAPDGNLLVADSHYKRILVYAPDTPAEGQPLRIITGDAQNGGEFGYVADVEQDAQGNFYVTEFGDDREVIRKLSPEGKLLTQWGGHGMDPGQFSRPRGMAISTRGELYVADSCNHRIQVFDLEGKLLRHWGTSGKEQGQLNYPYDVALGPGDDVFVIEYGNHRVQRFSLTGEPRGLWGGPGREPGRLHSPWGLAVDARGRVQVADTENHRVQRIAF